MSFSDNVWWTRKARIQTEKRLLNDAFQSQILLLWYSFTGVAASIYYLKLDTSNSDMSGIIWVAYSVLVLCMSGFINGLSFKERAGLIKECYEALNSVFQRAGQVKDGNTQDLEDEYRKVLSVCENHTDADYYLALCEAHLTDEDPQKNLDRHPTKFHWSVVVWVKIKHCLMLLFLYALPVLPWCFLKASV